MLEALLADDDRARDILPALPGAELGASAPVLEKLASQEGAGDASLRCLAMASLPREAWPADHLAIVLAGLAEPGTQGPERLAPQLAAAERTRLLEALAAVDDAEVWQRALPLLRGAEVGERHLALAARCPDEALPDLLRFLREAGLDLRAEAARHIRGDDGVERRRAWMLELAAVPGDLAPVTRPACSAATSATSRSGSWPGAGRVRAPGPGRGRGPDRHASSCCTSRPQVPEGFWCGRLEDQDRRQRRMHGAAARAGPRGPRVNRRRRGLRARAGRRAAAAMLAVVLSQPDAEAARKLGRLVLARDIPGPRRGPRRRDSRAPAAAAAALAELEGTRLAGEAQVLAARRGVPAALAAMRADPAAHSERDLRICRKPLAASLTAEDAEQCARLLAGSPAFVRREVGEWLRLRPDLPLGELAEQAYAKEGDFEAREVLLAAAIAHDRLAPIDALVERWLDHSDEEAEGLLLTAVGTLPFAEHPRQERLLLELLLGRALRDPLAAVRQERGRRFLTKRLAVLSPLLGPIVERLVALSPQRFADLLALVGKHLDPAALSKGTLLRICLEANRYVGGLEVLAPLVRLGLRLPPWPHEADAGLLLLEAELLGRAGRYREALDTFDKGMSELTLHGFRSREIETLVLGLLGPSDAGPWRQLRKRRALIEAACRHLEGRADEARAAVERARRAADGGFDDEERRFLRGIASPAVDGGR
ncbi:MAG: hypothetical protein R3F30_09045 [Planctomycetota bacterium]